jgi:hypothetical protein
MWEEGVQWDVRPIQSMVRMKKILSHCIIDVLLPIFVNCATFFLKILLPYFMTLHFLHELGHHPWFRNNRDIIVWIIVHLNMMHTKRHYSHLIESHKGVLHKPTLLPKMHEIWKYQHLHTKCTQYENISHNGYNNVDLGLSWHLFL